MENIIPVELKAVSALDNTNLLQGINQREAGELEIGLLINFGNVVKNSW